MKKSIVIEKTYIKEKLIITKKKEFNQQKSTDVGFGKIESKDNKLQTTHAVVCPSPLIHSC
jgi:hypothetical protein